MSRFLRPETFGDTTAPKPPAGESVEAFIARGGVIERLDSGVMSTRETQMREERRRSGLEGARKRWSAQA